MRRNRLLCYQPLAGVRNVPAVVAVWTLLVILLGAAGTGAAADPPTVRISRVAAEPRLDDFLDGRSPAGMTKVTGFVQREPKDGEPATRETTAFVGYDDRNFYAVFVCKEDPGAVRAHMTKRESIMGDDVVGVIFDTFHDRRHAYLFLVNPLGIQLDGMVTEGQDDDYSFDTLWHSEGRLTSDGYVVRITVPFRSLRFKAAPAQEWGIALGRIIPRNNETSFWPHVTRQLAGFGEQLATLQGLERISPGRNLQLIPYGAFTGARFLDESVPAYASRKEGRAGLDAKMVVRDALTLDLALNPDFSQVESDEPQVTINQRFEVQFPEKRPFFIENSSYFTTREDLFFSRRIADPQFGARLTGRLGRWNVAGLVMDDQAPGERVPAGSEQAGRRTLVAVGRVVREFARQSTVGVLVTDREFGTSFNRVASADVRLRAGDHWTATGQAIASETRQLDGTALSGPAFLGNLSYTSRALNVETSYTDRSPGFRSELGFVPRSDIRRWNNEFSYKRFPKGQTVLSWGPGMEASAIWDHRQQLQEWEVNPEFQVELPRSTELHLFAARAYELYSGLGFDKRRGGFFFRTEWLRSVSGMLSYHRGSAINYYPPAGQLPSLADATEVEAGMTVKPSPRLRIEQTYIYDSLSSRGGLAPAGTRIFTLHLLRTKANYQFTRALSLRAILDYNVLEPNGGLVALERDRRFTADVLATYLVNPGTALHVGVTDAYANLRLDPMQSPALQRTGSATLSTGRQFFVKMSYLLRF